MTTTSTMSLRPMGLLEIVDQTFRLYRSNFWVFFGIAAAIYVPLGVLQTIPVIGVLANVVFLPVYLVAAGALTKAVSNRYLGETAGVGDAYRYVWIRVWPFLVTMLAAYVLVASGLLLLLVGAIVFGFWIAFVPQVFLIEGRRYFDAVWRSRFLIGKGVWGELIVLMIIVGILTALIEAAAGLVLGAPFMFFTTEGQSQSLWTGIVFGLVESLVLPIGQVATVLLYYDSRIRKEGFDLQMLAAEMGARLPEPREAQPGAPPTEPGTAPGPPPEQPSNGPGPGSDRENV